MQQLFDLYHKESDVLHHAYFLISHNLSSTVSSLNKFLHDKFGIKKENNPDFHHFKFNTFTIDHAREISNRESQKKFSGDKKIFIIEFDFITEEAQNSLLKVFEEPREGTHFFIISPQDIILPTLRSRMIVFHLHQDFNEDPIKSEVLDMTLAEKMSLAKDIAESISDEEKSKQDAINLINKIELEIYKKGIENNARKIEICEKAREALCDRGAPVKMILENVLLAI